MILIKQAFRIYQNNLRRSLLLGTAVTSVLAVFSLIPLIAPYLIAAGLLFGGYFFQLWILEKKEVSAESLKGAAIPSAVGGLLLIPFIFLVGLGISILKNKEFNISVFSFALILFLIASFFCLSYLIAVLGFSDKQKNFLKALDLAFKITTQNIVSLFWSCFLIACGVYLSTFTFYLGFILIIPLLYISAHLFTLKFKET